MGWTACHIATVTSLDVGPWCRYNARYNCHVFNGSILLLTTTDILLFLQVWLATHLGVEVLHPQSSAFKTYYRSGHSQTIWSVREEYEKLGVLTEDAVT